MEFTVIIDEFKNVTEMMIRNYTPYCLNMISICATIDFLLTMMYETDNLEDVKIFMLFLKKSLCYGFFAYLIGNYEEVVMQQVLAGFIQLGNIGVGIGTASTMMVSPGKLLLMILGLISPFFIGGTLGIMALDKLGVESIPIGVFLLIIGIILFATLTCLEIVITFAKFYLISGMAIILLPFGVFTKTRDIGMKGIHAILAVGIEVMTLTIVVNLCDLFIDKFIGKITLNDKTPLGFIGLFIVIIVLFGLITRVPAFAATLISGSLAGLGMTSAAAGGSVKMMGQGATAIKQLGQEIYDNYKSATD